MRRITPDSKLKVSASAVSREVQGEEVILDLGSGLYFGLDPVGSSAWRLLQEGASLEELRSALWAEYEVDADRLERDLLELLAELGRQGLIEHA